MVGMSERKNTVVVKKRKRRVVLHAKDGSSFLIVEISS